MTDCINKAPCIAIILLIGLTVSTTASHAESGTASVYASGDTKNGDGSDASSMTAAHRSLPFGTKVRVTNRRNGNSVVVLINDRGPFHRGRVIDVSPAAARALDFSGLTPVTLTVVGR